MNHNPFLVVLAFNLLAVNAPWHQQVACGLSCATVRTSGLGQTPGSNPAVVVGTESVHDCASLARIVQLEIIAK